MKVVAALDQALRSAGVPITGVSVGRVTDKDTWRVDFSDTATAENRDTARVLIAAYDVLETATPSTVPNFKLRIALRRAGLMGRIVAYVAALDAESKDAWEYSTDINYNSPFVVAACVALNISDAQRTAVFKAAAAL